MRGDDYAPAPARRFLAEGRDAVRDRSTRAWRRSAGFSNDGDNEITGIHVSDGDPTAGGLLGAKDPAAVRRAAGASFWTQQHGDNVTWEIIANPSVSPYAKGGDDSDDRSA